MAVTLAACTFSRTLSVYRHPIDAVPAPGPVSSFNAEEELSRGRYLEVLRWLEGVSAAQRERNPRYLALYGRALLACGDLDAARRPLQRAMSELARPAQKAEMAWLLAQDYILANDFGAAREYADSAVGYGRGLPPGFVRFLEALKGAGLYSGVRVGETTAADFQMEPFNLIRLPVRVNEKEALAVFDTGAAYTIVTRTLAREAGVREIPDSDAYGWGLHKREIPLTFGVASRLEFAGFSLREVPVVLIPDEALTFETSRGEFPIPAVLGLHLLKEFNSEIDYSRRRLTLTRVNARLPKADREQNMFFARGKLFVRGSVNLGGWYRLLLDTGSEPTMLTSAGLRRAGIPRSGLMFPMRVQGIGKSRVEWGKIRNVAIGIDKYLVRFEDLLVKEDDEALEDGIVGASFLGNFGVRMDFVAMKLTLEPQVRVSPGRYLPRPESAAPAN